MEPQLSEVTQKLEEVKLESEEHCEKLNEIKLVVGDEGEIVEKPVDETKRNSLSKIFRFSSMKSCLSMNNVNDESAKKKVSKQGKFSRFLSKKSSKEAESDEIGSEVKPRRSPIMRGFFSFPAVPWIGIKTSQMNLQKPIEVPAQEDDDDAAPEEIATNSVIF